MEYFEKLFQGVDEGLKEEFFKRKRLQEENFNENKDSFSETFWDLYLSIAELLDDNSPLEQRFFIRAGIVDPRYMTKEDIERIKEVLRSEEDDVIFYADEWIVNVKKGKIPPSTFEDVIQEVKQERSFDVTWIEKEYERKLFERTVEEERLKDLVKGVQGKGPYSKGVYAIFDEIIRSIGKLKKNR
ncbi:MAG: hypothetical protein ABDH59_03650 [Fervidobacterium sp.]